MPDTPKDRDELRARIAELEAELTASQADNATLREALISREARRLEILDWLQEVIGTAWKCQCGVELYNIFGPECSECGRTAPLANRIAFKLHASGTDNPDFIAKARTAELIADKVRDALGGGDAE